MYFCYHNMANFEEKKINYMNEEKIEMAECGSYRILGLIK